jgi:hypothetical protein
VSPRPTPESVPGSETTGSTDAGVAYYSEGCIQIVLAGGEDHIRIEFEDREGIDTEDLDLALQAESMLRTGPWTRDPDSGELEAPILLSVLPIDWVELTR